MPFPEGPIVDVEDQGHLADGSPEARRAALCSQFNVVPNPVAWIGKDCREELHVVHGKGEPAPADGALVCKDCLDCKGCSICSKFPGLRVCAVAVNRPSVGGGVEQPGFAREQCPDDARPGNFELVGTAADGRAECMIDCKQLRVRREPRQLLLICSSANSGFSLILLGFVSTWKGRYTATSLIHECIMITRLSSLLCIEASAEMHR